MNEPAVSTVALTLYNYLVLGSGTVRRSTLLADPRIQVQHACSAETLAAAMDGLVAKGFVVQTADCAFVCPVDHLGRIVVHRDRSDVWADEHGQVQGGWDGWQVNDPQGGHTLLEEIVR